MISRELAVYVGNEDAENVDIELVEITFNKGETRWIQKKADKNCFSRVPEDCLVWCREEVPAHVETFRVLLDLTQSDNYVMETIEYSEIVDKDSHTEWRVIVCSNQITPRLVTDIQEALRQSGYPLKDAMTIDQATRKALIAFQKDHQLPVGNLDMETLNLLRVSHF